MCLIYFFLLFLGVIFVGEGKRAYSRVIFFSCEVIFCIIFSVVLNAFGGVVVIWFVCCIIVSAGSRLIAFNIHLWNRRCFLLSARSVNCKHVYVWMYVCMLAYVCLWWVCVVFVVAFSSYWTRMAHGFVIFQFGIISFVLYDYYPLGVSFLFYFANSTYNYRAALPIKRAANATRKRQNKTAHKE